MLKYNLKDLTKAYENGIVNKAYDGSKLVYQRLKKEEEPTKNYLAFTALEDGTFAFGNNINYSLDNGKTWTELAANTFTPTIASGSKIMWKAELTPHTGGIGTFSSTGRFDAEGDPMSLLYGDNFEDITTFRKGSEFSNLFKECVNLVSAEKLILKATTLASNCYSYMFRICTNLEKVPTLPATTLSSGCYTGMFYRCTSLTTAPELPATTLNSYCYFGMFEGCTSLNYIKCLATDKSASNCTYNWLENVAASGTFVKKSGVVWESGHNGIPKGWTVEEE